MWQDVDSHIAVYITLFISTRYLNSTKYLRIYEPFESLHSVSKQFYLAGDA